MVAIHDNPFAAEPRHPPEERSNGIQHIAEILNELFGRFPLPTVEIKAEEVEDLVAT